jgi:Rrf2 family protein
VRGASPPAHKLTGVRVSAKTDYALRAALELAAAPDEKPVKGERIATAQAIPLRFLENILMQLRHAGLVESRRGADGGYRLARPAAEVTLADVIRAIDGPLAGVSGARPETLDFTGVAEPMRDVWIAVRASLRGVLEGVTLADVIAGDLPQHVRTLVADEDAWVPH